MVHRRRETKPLKRVTARRAEFRTIIVFCEGKKSEPDYINGLKKLPNIANRAALNLVLHPERGVPLTLVQMAIARKVDPEVDECWCVFDVEWQLNHPNLLQTVNLARSKNIKLAISNPCFEVWLILHHKDFTRHSNTNFVESESRKIDGRTGKSIDASIYMPLREDAAHRAEKLAMRHEGNGTAFPNDNPSSSMFEFLRSVEKQ
jgi:hypothetical protein